MRAFSKTADPSACPVFFGKAGPCVPLPWWFEHHQLVGICPLGDFWEAIGEPQDGVETRSRFLFPLLEDNYTPSLGIGKWVTSVNKDTGASRRDFCFSA